MKFFFVILIIIFFQNCSFDNKSGIWKNENSIPIKSNDSLKDFKEVNFSTEDFKKVIPIKEGFEFKKFKSLDNYNWRDVNYDHTNNFKNFRYNENFKLIFKSKKITKYNINNDILFENNNLITTDENGNIVTFSINENKIISKYNFYKKKYKKTNKRLNIIIDNGLVYVSDNLGYLYAYSYTENKIIWAKKYEIAFRSNIKIYKNKIITSNQNNNLVIFNKKDGEILNVIPTEETIVKNKFENNLSLNNKFIFFINTFGSLYAIDCESLRIVWFINLNQSVDLNPSNIFIGNKIVSNKEKLVISSNEFTYIINQNTGSIINKKNFTSDLKPIILDDYLFAITKNKYLISMDVNNGELIYSYDLNLQIAEFLNTKKKDASFKYLMILNGKIVIFLENSYILVLNIDGSVDKIEKLPTKITSSPIIIDKSILYLDKKNRISIVD